MVIVHVCVAVIVGGCTIGALYPSVGAAAVIVAPFITSVAILVVGLTFPTNGEG
jgi:hypothetical protein